MDVQEMIAEIDRISTEIYRHTVSSPSWMLIDRHLFERLTHEPEPSTIIDDFETWYMNEPG